MTKIIPFPQGRRRDDQIIESARLADLDALIGRLGWVGTEVEPVPPAIREDLIYAAATLIARLTHP